MPMTSYVPLRERARGKWPGILAALGIPASYLRRKKKGPCPFCGGNDRYRFTDHNRDGMFYCNQCGPGNGIELVKRFFNLTFKEAAPRIEAAMGEAHAEPSPLRRSPATTPRPQRTDQDLRRELDQRWAQGVAIEPGDPVDLWLRKRGFALSEWPPCLRCTLRLQHCDDDGVVTWHPAMLALVVGLDGTPGTIHRTYLTQDGNKAAVDQVRKFAPRLHFPPGGAVRLAPPGPVLGIAEGIETALAAAMLFNIPVWSAISAEFLKTFVPPVGTERLLIFGDNDPHGAGQDAANELAGRLTSSMRVKVHIPDRDKDWNNVLLAARGAA
jgi:putative DNA primase/helicase